MISTMPDFIASSGSGLASPAGLYSSRENVAVESVDPLRGTEWERLIEAHPNAGFFHTSAWARVLAGTYGHRPFYLRISRGAKVVAAVPLMEVRSIITGNRAVSLPFSDLCDPLVFGEAGAGATVDVLSGFSGRQGWRHIEFRGDVPVPASAAPWVSFHGHELDLRCGGDALLAGFHGSVRRAIRKAESSGLKAEISTTMEAVADFYRLHVRTRRKHGNPPQPMGFFRNIFEHVIACGLGFVVLVKAGEKVIAAGVFLHNAKKAVFKFGASDESALQARGNNLAMWTAIRHLSSMGAESLHFGRTSIGNEGLRRFKLGWGSVERTVNYFRYAPSSKSWLAGRDRAEGIHTAIFQKLPIALNRLVGAMIYPHLD